MEGVTPIRSYSSDYNLARTATQTAGQSLAIKPVVQSSAKSNPEFGIVLSAPAKSRAEAEALAHALASNTVASNAKPTPDFTYEVKLLENEDTSRVDAGEAVSTYQQVASIDQSEKHSTDKVV